MDIHAQVDKLLRELPPASRPVSEHLNVSDEVGYEVDPASYTSGSLFVAYRVESDSAAESMQHRRFSDNESALIVQKLHASLSEWKKIKFEHRDDWTEGFLESMRLNKEPLRQEIFACKTHEEVLDVLSKNGLDEFRQDYVDYLVRRQSDLDEDENPNIFLESLQSWAWFLLDYTKLKFLPKAETSADFDGCLEMEWELSPDEIQDDPENEFYGNGRGLAVLTFYPASLNHLSILSGAYTGGKQRITLDCFLPHEKTIQIIDLFTERLLHPYE